MIRELEMHIGKRVPIFAVSASLKMEEEDEFREAGFDGWLLKPIDFRRLSLLLGGAFSDVARREGYYHPDRFGIGGWFGRT
jgi:CheY-like chemotaxis protein